MSKFRFLSLRTVLSIVVLAGVSNMQYSLAYEDSVIASTTTQVGSLLYGQTGSTDADIRSSLDASGLPNTLAADDFVVPASGWLIQSVVAFGNVGASGASFDVTIWSDSAGLPGTAICTLAGETNSGTTNNPIINLSTPCGLVAGTYWVSLQHQSPDATGWFWINTTTGITNSPAVWQAPGTFGCPQTWLPLNDVTNCTVQTSPDRQFELYGSVLVSLAASATCNGANLDVTISAGDAPFDITASAGINTPVNSAGIGTTTISGPEKWDNLTVTETTGNLESINLGQFKCRSGEVPTPLTPAHQSHTTNAFPLFSWTAITGASNYRVFVFDDKVVANRTVDIRQNSGGPTSMTLSTPLPNGRLFWRVRGRQNRLWSLWSVRFTLFKDPAPPFTIMTPVPTIDLNPPAGDGLAPTPVPTFPPPPNTR
ncbi:MAG: hypothetical protein L0154_20520 [Chloroflexi bacterium]|nr:hypothetical protein [Chloroflexota bacterium]